MPNANPTPLTRQTLDAAKQHFSSMQDEATKIGALIRALQAFEPPAESSPFVIALLQMALEISDSGEHWFQMEDFLNSLDAIALSTDVEVAQ